MRKRIERLIEEAQIADGGGVSPLIERLKRMSGKLRVLIG